MSCETIALPLTAPQYGMWAAQQLDPGNPCFWTAEAVEFVGELNEDALRAAVTETLAACDALHMRYFLKDAQVAQQPDLSREIDFSTHDFSGTDPTGVLAHGWMQRDLRCAPDLEHGPLFRTALLKLGPQRHLWYLRAHHIALDGFAYLLLIKRVAQVYSAQCAGVASPQSRDWSLQPVVAEELAYRGSPDYTCDRAFWQLQFAGMRPPVTLAPLRPPAETTRSQRHVLPFHAYAAWQASARACGVDWAAWLVAVIAAWMQQRSGADEVSLGLLVMNRLGSAALCVPCMGMNVLPLRIPIDRGQPFDTFARRVAELLREARRHQRYNYEWMREDCGLAGTYRQLYGPVLNLMPFDRAFTFAGLVSRALPVSVGSVEDLDITVSPLADGVRFDFEANPAAYSAATLRAHHATLLQSLGNVVARADAAIRDLFVASAISDCGRLELSADDAIEVAA